MLKSKLIILIFLSLIFCQFNKTNVSIDLNRLSNTDKFLFENFEYEIKDYFLNNNFCPECEDMEIEIKCHFSIESVQNIGSQKIINSQLFISNEKDHFFYSKAIRFPYNRGQAIIFNPNSSSNLSAILNYYAFSLIAFELDTWDIELGTHFFNKVIEISENATYSNISNGWEERKENMLFIKNFREFRTLRFQYYDIIYKIDNEKKISDETNKIIIDFIDNLKYIYKKYGSEKNTLKFIQSNPKEIATIFNKNSNTKNGFEILMLFDDKNKNIYEKYLNEK
tara:strand:+ start:5211 stop:6053 length:843 start_codon:yes stop_codon:yes gene_type:complete